MTLLAMLLIVAAAIITISLLASVIGFAFKIAIIIVAAAIIYRLYLDYKK